MDELSWHYAVRLVLARVAIETTAIRVLTLRGSSTPKKHKKEIMEIDTGSSIRLLHVDTISHQQRMGGKEGVRRVESTR